MNTPKDMARNIRKATAQRVERERVARVAPQTRLVYSKTSAVK